MSKELKALKSDRLYLTKCEVTEQQSVMAAASDIKHHLKHGLTHIIMAAGVNAINESEELNYDLVSPEEMMEVRISDPLLHSAVSFVLSASAACSGLQRSDGGTCPQFDAYDSQS